MKKMTIIGHFAMGETTHNGQTVKTKIVTEELQNQLGEKQDARGKDMAKVEVLCVTMNQNDFKKINEMNISTNVVFANQANDTRYEEMKFGENVAKMITTSTKGVGINRNLALIYATGEYLLFSDDDLKYVDNYSQIIEDAFLEVPNADCLIFNIDTIGADIPRRKNQKVKRIRWYRALNYGAVRIAVKRTAVSRENIMFNQNFGGGTDFSCGEDTLYIVDMLRKGLKLYVYPQTIATVDQSTSTWFRGYNEKYYYDKGILYASISKRHAKFLCLQDLIRHPDYKKEGLAFFKAYKFMKKGIKNHLKMQPFNEEKI